MNQYKKDQGYRPICEVMFFFFTKLMKLRIVWVCAWGGGGGRGGGHMY